MLKVKKYVSEFYKSDSDIPSIIAPSENGWQGPGFNRQLNPGTATIIITAENAKPLHISITVLNEQDKRHGIMEIET